MRLTLILFVLLTLSAAVTGKPRLDSLLAKLETSTGEEKVDVLNSLVQIYKDQSDHFHAKQYAVSAINVANSVGYTHGKVDGLNKLSGVHFLQNDIDSAMYSSNAALVISKEINYLKGESEALRQLGIIDAIKGNHDKALEKVQNSLKLALKIKDQLQIASAYFALGNVHVYAGKPVTAIDYYFNSLKILDKHEETYHSALVYMTLGSLYANILNNYPKALESTLKALLIYEREGDDIKAAYSMIVLGNIYEYIGDLDKALDFYEKAHKNFERISNDFLISDAKFNIGIIFQKKGSYKRAIEYFETFYSLSEKLNNNLGMADALNSLGECYLSLGNNEIALGHFNKSFSILNRINNKLKLSIVTNNIGTVYRKQNHTTKALNFFHKAYAAASEVGAGEQTLSSLRNLSEVYAAAGDYANAYNFLWKSRVFDDSLKKLNQSSLIAELQTNYETELQQKEIELLRKSEAINELELRRNSIINFSLVIFSLLILIMALIYYNRFKFKKKALSLLEEQNKKIIAQSEELNRINFELQKTNMRLLDSEGVLRELNATKDKFFSIVAHDLKVSFNSLLGLTELLSEDNSSLSREEIRDLNKNVNDSAKKVSLLLQNVLQWAASQLGGNNFKPEVFILNEIIKESIQLYGNAAKAKNVSLTADLNEKIVVKADKNMIGSVLRNLIHNAVKFSSTGGNVSVKAAIKRREVEVEVSDNGVGIREEDLNRLFKIDSHFKTPGTQNEIGTGLGLIIANEFLKKNSGKISVESSFGKGSTFKFTLPKF